MELEVTQKGTLASIECSKCGCTQHWHEWCDEGQAEDLKHARCHECGGVMNEETYWESPSRNWYAGRLTEPGYLDCTTWEFDTNRQRLIRELRAWQ